jgi:serine phosphatase RsbU (regulator of sigma subunit)
LPLLLRSDGSVQTLGVPGTVLGVVPDVRFTATAIDLVAGDIVVLYTDGMTDTRDHPLDEAALAQLFLDAHHPDLENMVDSVEKAMRELRARQEDDIALLVIGIDDPNAS